MKCHVSYLIFFFALLGIVFQVSAQRKVLEKVKQRQQTATTFSVQNLFSRTNTLSAETIRKDFINGANVVSLSADKNMLQQIVAQKPEFLQLEIPFVGNSTIKLDLIPIEIFGPKFKLLNSKFQEVNVNLESVHFQGIIHGDNNSVVSLSIVNNRISGIIANDKGNYNLGQMPDNKSYVIYNEAELKAKNDFVCSTIEDSLNPVDMSALLNDQVSEATNCEPVSIYFEVDHAIFKAQDASFDSTMQFVAELFTQVAVLYSNENIDIVLSALRVWESPDPYIDATNTRTALSLFNAVVDTFPNGFEGDLAHLLLGRNLGGGVAYIDRLCTHGTGLSANITNTVVSVPTFSWNVEVVTHELGHNFGSPHTHSCTWPGGAIDTCYTPEGTCVKGPAPTNGGTIMSYCHLTSYGINLNNGFGPLPGDLIRSATNECYNTSGALPSNLRTTRVYGHSAYLEWDHAEPFYFDLEYKKTTASEWIRVEKVKQDYFLENLDANISYNWRVKYGCGAFVSASFTTNAQPFYCIPNSLFGCIYATGINDFKLNTVSLNPNSGCSTAGFSEQTDSIVSLNYATPNSFTLYTLDSSYALYVYILIDLNADFDFDDAGELVYTQQHAASASFSGEFTLPKVTEQADTRMRIITSYYPLLSACTDFFYGEVEDYRVSWTIPCLSSLTFTDPTDSKSSGTYFFTVNQIDGIITATNKILNTGTKVEFISPKIFLNPGFEAKDGAVFKAETGGCN